MSVTCGQCDARPTVTFSAVRHHRPLAGPHYTAWQRHMRVNNLPRVALDRGEAGIRTRDLLIVSPASQPLSHCPRYIPWKILWYSVVPWWGFWLYSLTPFWWPFSRWTRVSWYLNVSILDFDETGGGDNWSYKTCYKSSSQIVTINKPNIEFVLQAGYPSCCPTNSVVRLYVSN